MVQDGFVRSQIGKYRCFLCLSISIVIRINSIVGVQRAEIRSAKGRVAWFREKDGLLEVVNLFYLYTILG